MLKMMITDAVVSKGYNGDPAIRYFDVEGGGQIASFRIGKRLYDSKAPDNHRWLNFNVKASKNMCERIKRMKLKEGSYINIGARYDEETWKVKGTDETRTSVVLHLDEIEYAGGGNGQKISQTSSDSTAPQGNGAPAPQIGESTSQSQQQGYSQNQQIPQGQPEPAFDTMPSGFTGYEAFGDSGNPFF